MPMLHAENDADVGAAPAPASPEFFDRPHRRAFTAKDKLRLLALTDQAAGSGAIGAIPRREGIYSSTLCDWRRQRDGGAFNALAPAKRGPKATEANPLAAEVASLPRHSADRTRRLARAETIMDMQKKLQPCWCQSARKKDPLSACKRAPPWDADTMTRLGAPEP